MTNKAYNIIKDFSLLWFPAGITLIGVIWSAWGLPYGEPILATLTGADAFLGAVVKYFKYRYDKSSDAEDNEDETDGAEE